MKKNNLMSIVRTEIARDIENNLGYKIIFLHGKEGSGKSYLAEAVAKNNLKKNNLKKTYESVRFIQCVKYESKENDKQIFNWDSFLSVMLLQIGNFEYLSPYTSTANKEKLLRQYLINPNKKILFIFDDFDTIEKENEKKWIFDFLNNSAIYRNHPIIITSTQKLSFPDKNTDSCFEKELKKINDLDFEQILENHIEKISNKTLKNNIIKIQKAITKKEYYDFVRQKSNDDLRLMHDIQIYIVLKLFNKKDQNNLKQIKDNFYNIRRECNNFERGILLKEILKILPPKVKFFLYAISLFNTPIPKDILKKISGLNDKDIEEIEEQCVELYLFAVFFNLDGFLIKEKIEKEIKCNEIYIFNDFLKREQIKKEENSIEFYSLSKTLRNFLEGEIKDALRLENNPEIKRKDNNGKYSKLITNWINYYKKATKGWAEILDTDLSTLDIMSAEFDNISRVLDYCDWEDTFESWNDYYEISDTIWYFSEITYKDINKYHFKRFEIASKIKDTKKIFESALHYCNISFKKSIFENPNVDKCYNELEDRIDIIQSESNRLSIKYKYTQALKCYFSSKDKKMSANEARKLINEAELLFKQCEEELPELIKKEDITQEKNQLVKDYISTVKWHSTLFLDKYNAERATVKDFIYLIDKIDYSLAYELKYKLDYSRVIASILINRIQILPRYKDIIQDFEQKLKYDSDILENLQDTTISKAADLSDEYDNAKKIVNNIINSKQIKNSVAINNTLDDNTQKIIFPILQETQALLLAAINKVSGSEGKVSLVAMPDLGLANNIIRMSGGFFTGMFLEWESKVPIVPIDSTINSCGVAIYILKKEISIRDFKNCFINVEKRIKEELDYNWNFQRGNHFITLGKIENGKYCIIMHASADEYKKDMENRSLYPPERNGNNSDVWYYNDIQEIKSRTNNNRYLRYLYGNSARKFILTAIKLQTINHIRMKEISNYLFSDYLIEEMTFVPHYGMPNNNSIAIGCSWKKNESVLLTAPGKDIYVINPLQEIDSGDNNWLTPHGLGVSASIKEIKYKDGIYINNKRLQDLEDVKEIKDRSIRCRNNDKLDFQSHINKTLLKCNGKIKTTIHPIATLSAEGFEIFE